MRSCDEQMSSTPPLCPHIPEALRRYTRSACGLRIDCSSATQHLCTRIHNTILLVSSTLSVHM